MPIGARLTYANGKDISKWHLKVGDDGNLNPHLDSLMKERPLKLIFEWMERKNAIRMEDRVRPSAKIVSLDPSMPAVLYSSPSSPPSCPLCAPAASQSCPPAALPSVSAPRHSWPTAACARIASASDPLS